MTDNPCQPGLPTSIPEGLIGDHPDGRRQIIDATGKRVGQYSLWWNQTPPSDEHRVGVIGHYAVDDDQAARRGLTEACDELAEHGCTLAVGPMDGSTWRSYRMVTDVGSEPAFFLEPGFSPERSMDFQKHGFRILARYVSGMNTNLAYESPRVNRARKRIAAAGVSIRRLDLDHWERDLHDIWSIAKVSFRDNLLFTEIMESDFIGQCDSLRQWIDPRLVFIATDRDQPVGFLLALPDVMQAGRGESIDTVIVKSLAVLPDRCYAGLGHWLLVESHSVALGLGYSRVIHALMRENSLSHRLSQRYATTMRRYAIFAKELRP